MRKTHIVKFNSINYTILNPDGSFHAKCSRKKFEWYLNKTNNAATIVDENTIQLNFKPIGKGSLDPYHNQNIPEICVICGSNKKLTLHHVIPYCYRKYFPTIGLRAKDRHDVLLVCKQCHCKYEKYADKLKRLINKEYKINKYPKKYKLDTIITKLIKASKNLLDFGDLIPENRKRNITNKIKATTIGELTDEILLKNTKIDIRSYKENSSKHVFSKISNLVDLQNFVERWRIHFLKHANPKFLPSGWNVNRSIFWELRTPKKRKKTSGD